MTERWQRLAHWLRQARQGDLPWLLAACAALALSLAPPSRTVERALVEHVVVFDVTQSMNVADQQLGGQPVSRLAYARHLVHEALPLLPCGARLGWAVFTEYRSFLLFTPVEVCEHRAELRASLAQIDGRIAWAGNSEVAKGLYSAINVVKALPSKPSVVFVTDGHEAPPLNPRYRPPYDGKPGEVPGLLLGVGETTPRPIPKTDPFGRPLGVWDADEVLQTDPRSLGRGGSVGAEAMVDDAADGPAAGAALGATPGQEHLSSLREPYLRLLASELGFGYHRLGEVQDLVQALTDDRLTRPVPVRTDAREPLIALALALLLVPTLRQAARSWRSRRGARSGALGRLALPWPITSAGRGSSSATPPSPRGK